MYEIIKGDSIAIGSVVDNDCEMLALSRRKRATVVAIIGPLAILEFREPGLAGFQDIDDTGKWRRGCFVIELYLR